MSATQPTSPSILELLKRLFSDWASTKADRLTEIGEVFSAPTADAAGKELGRQHRRQTHVQALQQAMLAQLEARKDRIAHDSRPERPADSITGNPQNGEF